MNGMSFIAIKVLGIDDEFGASDAPAVSVPSITGLAVEKFAIMKTMNIAIKNLRNSIVEFYLMTLT